MGQTLVSSVNSSTSLRRSRQNSSSSRPGFCFVLFFGPGTRGTLARPGEDGVPELVLQRFPDAGGDGVQALLAGGVPGMDQAAQRPLRLHGPDRARVALGAVLIVPQQVRQACLVPGDVLPPGMEVGWAARRGPVFMLDEPGPFPGSLPPNPACGFHRTGLSSDLCRVRDGVRVDPVVAGGADDERLAPHFRHERGPRRLARSRFPELL